MSAIGDAKELEGIKLALDLQKTCATISMASLAAFATYLKAAGIPVQLSGFFFAVSPLLLSLFSALAFLLFAAVRLFEGENPFEKSWQIVLMLCAPILLVVGIVFFYLNI